MQPPLPSSFLPPRDRDRDRGRVRTYHYSTRLTDRGLEAGVGGLMECGGPMG